MTLIEAIVQNQGILDKGESAWSEAAEIRQKRILEALPSGSGFDVGTKILKVSEREVILSTGFHHMNGNGYYTGWTEHTILIKPSFIYTFDISVSGRNVNDIKDYIAEVFNTCLRDKFQWLEKEPA